MTEADARLVTLFRELCDLSSDEQVRRLDALVPPDDALRVELESLLAKDPGDADALPALGPGEIALDAGSIVDDFRIEVPLGSGGAGRVFRATHVPTGAVRALKLLRNEIPTDEDRARLEREAALLSRIDHPSICRVYGAGHLAGRFSYLPYLVMDLVDGPDLLTHVSEGDVPLPERLALFVRVCEAVAAAHDRGVLHRDLKPANILVQPDGCPVVIDFGLAYPLGGDERARLTRTGRGVGTPGYMSPEQESGLAVDSRSDVYSLGILLHEVWTGTRPRRSRRGRRPRIAPAVPRGLARILATATARAPRARYADATELAEDVRRYAGGGRTRADRRYRIRYGVGVAVTASLVLGQVARWGARARCASAAWAAGDLARADRELDGVPAVLDRWMLGGGLTDEASALRARSSTSPAAAVLAAVRSGGTLAGVNTASAYIDRDGASASGPLVSWLARTLGSRHDVEPATLLAPVTVLMSCRPARSAEDCWALAPLREVLHAFVPDPACRAPALSCLSGSGDETTFDVIEAALRGSALTGEEVRLAGRALQLIVGRARDCGYLGRLDAPGILASTDAWEEARGAVIATQPEGPLSATRRGLFEAAAFALIDLGAGVPDRLQSRAIAAMLEPGRSGERALGLLSLIRSKRGVDHVGYELERLGEVVRMAAGRVNGSLAEAGLQAAATSGLSRELARFHFMVGYERIEAHRAGRYPELAPPSAARPAARLLAPEPSVRLVARPRASLGKAHAEWDFTRGECEFSGWAIGARAQFSRVVASDLNPAASYLQLVRGGSSSASCEVILPKDVPSRVFLALEAQRERRVLLPDEGRAWLEIDLGGRYVGTAAVDLADPAWIEFPLTGERLVPGSTRIEIRLDSESTTSVRLHRLRIQGQRER